MGRLRKTKKDAFEEGVEDDDDDEELMLNDIKVETVEDFSTLEHDDPIAEEDRLKEVILCDTICKAEQDLERLKQQLDKIRSGVINAKLKWPSTNVQDYRYYMCQECPYKSKREMYFVRHIRHCHPASRQVFNRKIKCNTDEIIIDTSNAEQLMLAPDVTSIKQNLESDHDDEDAEIKVVKKEVPEEEEEKVDLNEVFKNKYPGSNYTLYINTDPFLTCHLVNMRSEVESLAINPVDLYDYDLHSLKDMDITDYILDEQELLCYDCSTIMSPGNCEGLLKHWKQYHCKLPALQFGDKSLKPFPCGFCGTAFKDEDESMKHRNSHKHKAYTFFCPYCGCACKEKRTFEHHLAGYDLESGCLPVNDSTCVIPLWRESSTKGPYHCPDCDKVFDTGSRIKRHRQQVHDKKTPHVCSFCGKSYFDKFKLHVHIERVHLQLKTNVCDICGKLFGPRSVKAHRTVCKVKNGGGETTTTVGGGGGGVPTVCAKCGVMYSAHCLPPHRHGCKGHAPLQRSHKCEHCGLAFKYLERLESHVRTHTDSAHAAACKAKSKPYKCEMCYKMFATPTDLTLHMERHKNPVKCEMCNRSYLTRRAVLFHQKTCSPEAGDLSKLNCPHCPKVLKTKSAYVSHVKCHFVNPEELSQCAKYMTKICPFCKLRFVERRLYDQHVLECSQRS